MKIACAQLNYTLGDFAGNFKLIEQTLSQYGQSVDMIVFSELCLTGYYPLDLIDRAAFIEQHDLYLEKLIERSKSLSAAIVVGAIDKSDGPGKPFFNALFVIGKGQILHRYHKQLLPVYNIFNEARHFEPGQSTAPFEYQGAKIGFLICEDGWAGTPNALYHENPVTYLADKSLDLVISINGSPSNIGKHAERYAHFSAIAKQLKAPLLFTNQIGGNDDIIFDGASFVLDKQGVMVGQLPAFQEASGEFELTASDTITLHQGFQPPKAWEKNAFCYEQILLGLRDYTRKCHVPGVVIAVSGGIDSAITIAMAVEALGKDKVVALFLPSQYTSQESDTDTHALIENLGVKLYVRSIKEEFDLAVANFQSVFGERPSDLTQQNMQARIRGRIIMEYSNQSGFLVISTGNKSELSVGFTTLYGDLTGGFNLIGDLYKTEVYALSNFYNQTHSHKAIPDNILQRAPTPELAPNQTDQDTLPPYDQLDAVLKLYIEGDLLPKEDIQVCEHVKAALPQTRVQAIHRMVDLAEFKRRQTCPIIRVQRRAFGMGRQFPIARHYS